MRTLRLSRAVLIDLVVAAVVLLVIVTLWWLWLGGGSDAVSGEPGETVTLSEHTVARGSECVATSTNNASVHAGNVLQILHGGRGLIVVEGVEDEPDTVTTTEFTARGDVTLNIRLGESGTTSLDVALECETPPTTTPPTSSTTTTTSTTTSSVPPPTTSTPPPTTSVPPPVTTLPPTEPEPPTCETPTHTG